MSPVAFPHLSEVPPPQGSVHNGNILSSSQGQTSLTHDLRSLPEEHGVSQSLTGPALSYQPDKASAKLERDALLNGTAETAIPHDAAGLNGAAETAIQNNGLGLDGMADMALDKYGRNGVVETPKDHNGLTLNGTADTAIHNNSSTWSVAKEKVVLGPYDYLENQPGKDIRKQLITAFNACLHVPKESLEIITKVVGMLHTASLL